MVLMYLACMHALHSQPRMIPSANMSGAKSRWRCFFPHPPGGLPIREKLRSTFNLVVVSSAHTITRVVHMRPRCPSPPPVSACSYDGHKGTLTIRCLGLITTACESGSKPALPHESCPTLLHGGFSCRRPATAPLPYSLQIASFTFMILRQTHDSMKG